MKITVVTSYYPPDYTSLSNYYKDIAYDLAAYGAEVTLVCGIPTRLVEPGVTKYYADNPVEKINDNLTIIRTGPKKPEGKSLISRGIYHLYRSLRVYSKAKKIETDVYFICSAPPYLGYLAASLSKRAVTVYDLQDMFPDTLVSSGKAREKSMAVRLFRALERYVYRHSNCIRVISEDMAGTLKSRGVKADKITVIYNWVDENEVKFIDRRDNPMFDMLNMPREGFYVCYAGNIGLLQNLLTVIRAAEILQEREPGIQFVIIGDGAWKEEMLGILREKRLRNVQTYPMQDVKHTPYIYNLADIGVVTIASGVSKGSMPSKTWNILSASRPVVCEADPGSELERIIVNNECGICVAPGDAAGFANAVLRLYNDRELLMLMGKNGRAYAEKNITRKKSTKQLHEYIVNAYSLIHPEVSLSLNEHDAKTINQRNNSCI